MKNKKQKPMKIRVLAAVGTMMLFGSLVYIAFAGINYLAGAVVTVAVLGLGAPGIVAGESLMEMITGFFEMIAEGVMAIITGIFEAIGSIFN